MSLLFQLLAFKTSFLLKRLRHYGKALTFIYVPSVEDLTVSCIRLLFKYLYLDS